MFEVFSPVLSTDDLQYQSKFDSKRKTKITIIKKIRMIHKLRLIRQNPAKTKIAKIAKMKKIRMIHKFRLIRQYQTINKE